MYIKLARTDQQLANCIDPTSSLTHMVSTDPVGLLLGATGLLRYSCSDTKPEVSSSNDSQAGGTFSVDLLEKVCDDVVVTLLVRVTFLLFLLTEVALGNALRF